MVCNLFEGESVLNTASCDGGNSMGEMLSKWRFGRECCEWETALSGDRPLGAATGGGKVTLLTKVFAGNNCDDVVSGDAALCATSVDIFKSGDVERLRKISERRVKAIARLLERSSQGKWIASRRFDTFIESLGCFHKVMAMLNGLVFRSFARVG